MEKNENLNNKKEQLKKQIENLTNENNRLKEENKELINQNELKNDQEEYNSTENEVEYEVEQISQKDNINTSKKSLIFKIIVGIEILFAICVFFYISIFNPNMSMLEYNISDFVSSTDCVFSKILTLITACSIILGMICGISDIPNNRSSYIKTILVLLILIPLACLLLKYLSFLFIITTDQLAGVVESFEGLGDLEGEDLIILILSFVFLIGFLIIFMYVAIFAFILFVFCAIVEGLFFIFNKLISVVANSKNIKGIFILIILAILVSAGIYFLW